ncbi:PREDICTED: potassium/sodium hyperpolarization-activated cyclic nucleotide-gated channel 1-like [Habropoda laboriosa]|uniref:potassium/sodium hyperpolarization-activated cyclic nucleotide-gated channel 1-like n=1 Tax=Habropoda laboriosa TaxID=597456 RepID=UPI00083D5349|nr:PREDICTED: potassium/sodium hyperpolarization-activated cyclic nucleotide-gated channel 1-like [Habropoda laboriosa]
MDLMAYVPHFSEAPNLERIPVIRHICEQPQEQDELMNIRQGNKIWTKLSRWFLRQRIVSRKHPLTRWCLKSTTAVNYEISRHLKSHPYMIHPFSLFRIVWESLMTVFTIISLLITPVSITFYYEHHENWHTMNDIMNIVFLCDIVMWFFTGYYDYPTKVIVLDPMIVARKYLQSYFLIDLLTVLPIGILDYVVPNSLWYCTTLNMMKILRVRNIIVYSRRLHNVYRIGFQVHKILETIAIIVTCIHWSACLEYYVPKSVEVLGTLSNDSWIKSAYFQNKKTFVKKYLVCLNRATIAFVRSAHYLNMETPEDIILNMFLTILGFLGVIFLLTQFSQLMTTFNITIKRHLKIIQQLQEYIRYKELPYALQRRLLEFYHYRNKKGFERNKKIIDEVSPYLREELILHNYMRLISSVELFKHLPETVVIQLSSALRSEIYMTGDEVVKAGTRGEALYFVSSGTVAVYTAVGKEVCHLEDGSYFGEIALVMDSEHRIATVVAVEICEINVLRRDDFRRFISPYPDLLNRLQNVALDHLNKSLLLDVAQDLAVSHTPQYINISSIKSKRFIH